jgi:hypothetical protein
MIEQEYILLIMNCKKYDFKSKYQKETWLQLLPDFLKYYHVIGNPDLVKDFVFDNDNNILYVKTMDDYNSLPKKVFASYKAAYDSFPFLKYIYKTDDDQILTNPKFFDIITNLIKNKKPKTHYGGFIVDIETPYLSQYCKIHPELPENMILQNTKYCSGRFYFLSKHALINLFSKRDEIEKEYLEDYAIGLNLGHFYKENMLYINSSKYFVDLDSL